MNFLYRMHEGFGRGTSVEGFDGIKCLRNFLSCINNKDKLTIFIDNSSDEFCQTIKDIHPNIVKINLGNCKSFLFAVNYAIKNFDKEERVYFVENDYLHMPNIEKYLEDGFNTGAKFVGLYDHPDKYRVYPDLRSKIFLGKKRYWRTTPSTCMTFATTVESLITHFNFNGEFIDGLNLSLELQDTNKTLEIYKESNDVKGMVAKNGEDTDLKLYNIAYETGKWGLAAKFSGSKSYGQIDDSKYFDFPRNYDFAISMWIKIPPSQSYTTNSSNFIIGKNGNGIATIRYSRNR